MLNFKNILLCVQFLPKREYKTFLHIFLLTCFLLPFGEAGRSLAQNLIFNGDFEIYDTCPTNISTPGDLQIEHCTGWTAPTKLGTSDYFNVCNNTTTWQFAGVPQNLLGYQQALNGNGYGGILAWHKDEGEEYREYLQTELVQPLVLGNSYRISFYVSYFGYSYSLEKIGALFSVNDFNANIYLPIVATPQIINQNGFLTDSLNWTKIEGEFIANGGEQFLTIGYFEDSLIMSDTLNTHNEEFVSRESYYYVDGVELIDITPIDTVPSEEILIPNVFTPNKDGNNDLFYLNFNFEKVEIYNRWGQKLFESNNNESFWDGRTTSGSEVPNGTYYYIITSKEKKYKGFIQLLR